MRRLKRSMPLPPLRQTGLTFCRITDLVRSLAQEGNTSTVMMGAYRDWIPVSWTAEQINIPHIPEVRFNPCSWMDKGNGRRVAFSPPRMVQRASSLNMLWSFASRFFGGWIGEHIIGKFFVENIANKTLARMKFLTEGA